ncbi:hypothetical protein N7507_006574 [Penicillium longicatenatum]|nr:hypothetical protein N7507_006574 [Penicillium longicatenatum]
MEIEQELVDVVIVGTGLGGLAAAKTYLELSPQANLILIEKRATLGGVWAQENCYEGLKTNNLHGSYEFSDFPMDAKKYGVGDGEHIPCATMHRYFCDFADHFDIRRRVRFNTNVLEVEQLEDGWMLSTEMTDNAQQRLAAYKCKKLIIASGLASTPRPISISGQQDFDRPVISHARLLDKGAELASDPKIESVTVVGASKSGYDAVYLMASHGKKVQWVVRKSGGGAVWMMQPWVNITWMRAKLESLATTRFYSWFSPCIWGDNDGFGWIRRILHGTRVGRFLVHHFWEKMRMDAIELNGYRKEASIKHLEPTESLFWNARIGILNYPSDIHDYVRTGQVQILKQDVDHLSSSGTIHFTDESTMQTDALIEITGWSLAPTMKYKPDGLDASLGLPVAASKLTTEQETLWRYLDQNAEDTILSKFPYLSGPPASKLPYKPNITPLRLYRGIAPPNLTAKSTHSLAYVKMFHSTANMLVAEVQSLWVYAYLNDKITIPTENVYEQTALLSRFGKLRYPWGFSAWFPETIFDSIPYVDLLLRDLGLRYWRKSGVRREMFECYTSRDYRGINLEWMEKLGEKSGRK